MGDGVLLGALILLVGVVAGGVGMWVVERWHDSTRQQLLITLGRMQQALDEASTIPEEER